MANSLQLTVQRRKTAIQNGTSPSPNVSNVPSQSSLAAALSFAGLNFGSHNSKAVQLTLTPHHLFVLLSQIEELDVDIGPMNVRIESIQNESSPANYVSFLQGHNHNKARNDTDSIHSVSSIRSVMSGMSALWSTISNTAGSSKSERARLAFESDLKYVYAALTKLPSLRLSPDHRTLAIKGYEQFPFDTAVPLFAFKNLQQLEIIDLDFRSFHGWDRLADQLCLLTIKRGNVDDPIDVLEHIVLDDAERRRRRSNRWYGGASTPSWSMPSTPQADYARSHSDPGSPEQGSLATSPQIQPRQHEDVVLKTPVKLKTRSHTFVEGTSPRRPTQTRPATSYRHNRTYSYKAKRSGSGSSNSSDQLATPSRSDVPCTSTFPPLPASKWQKLIYLSLADNGLTSLPKRSLQPILGTLRSFNLAANLLTEVPESLAAMSRLVSLDMSNCMVESLQNMATQPLQAITTLKLKHNRIHSLSGIEKLTTLAYLDLSNNKITDPDEMVRLTAIPSLKKLWVKHNPMAKTFPDYRVRILNHFRKTPGFVDDIIIDDQPASYLERKQLVDRVMLQQAPLKARSKDVPEAKPVVVHEARTLIVDSNANKRASSHNLERGVSNASATRKKRVRRRMVDLGEDERATQSQPTDIGGDLDKPTSQQLRLQEVLILDKPSKMEPSLRDLPFSNSAEVSPSPQKLSHSADADDHRRQLEDLRIKFGDSWLSALNDSNSTSRSQIDLPNSPTQLQSPRLHHYHSSPPVIGVGGNSA